MSEKNFNSRESNDGGSENGDAPSTKSGAKRRASRAGTRSVATLTPEQLARKRANDREAQRNIRQRTRDHVESLEQRIRELTGGGHEDRNVIEIKRRNKELEEELRRLKDILGTLEDDLEASPLTASSMCTRKPFLVSRRHEILIVQDVFSRASRFLGKYSILMF